MIDTKTLSFIGLLFFGIAAVLTVRELQLGVGWSISMLLVATIVTRQFLKESPAKTVCLSLFVIAGTLTPIGYFGFKSELSFYVAIIVFFLGALYLVMTTKPQWYTSPSRNMPANELIAAQATINAKNLESGAITLSAIVSSMSLLWTTYFRYLTSMQDEFIARRLIFTLFLVLIGIVLSVIGRSKGSLLVGVSGMAYLGVGVAKALAYDTTHLTGFLRIGVFAGAGVLLLAGAGMMKKKEQAV